MQQKKQECDNKGGYSKYTEKKNIAKKDYVSYERAKKDGIRRITS